MAYSFRKSVIVGSNCEYPQCLGPPVILCTTRDSDSARLAHCRDGLSLFHPVFLLSKARRLLSTSTIKYTSKTSSLFVNYPDYIARSILFLKPHPSLLLAILESRPVHHSRSISRQTRGTRIITRVSQLSHHRGPRLLIDLLSIAFLFLFY